ncbi:MAG: DUF4363 family protein [Candidatus Limivicinus sp.]
MKKEIIALLLLVLLFAASLFNIWYFDRLCLDIAGEVKASAVALERGDMEAAQEHLNSALHTWLDADSYTHIFIRHPEIDSTADAFYELGQALEENSESCRAAYDKLLYHLESIRTMEHLRFGSIM